MLDIGDPVPLGAAIQPPVHNTINRDAVTPGVDVLRSIPRISSAVTHLLASYDQQAVQDALAGRDYVTRQKSVRCNTTDTTLVGPQLRWPNEGLVSASHAKKQPMMNMSGARHERRGFPTLTGGLGRMGCLHD